jgi:uncharacterized protein YdaU (DUF1376 family)
MNYYPHHIGDFNNATRHLSRLERALYRDMLDMYYDTEQPLTADMNMLCRKLMARDEEERTAVEQVLNEFFTPTEQGWAHARCDQVIAEYQAQIQKKSAAGKASAEARAAAKTQQNQPLTNSDDTKEHVLNTRSTNQEPITNNHKPEKSREDTQRASRLPADWSPSDEDIAFCRKERPELQPLEVAKRFRDFWIAVPGVKGRKTDWPATWRNWVRNERAPARASPSQAKEAQRQSLIDRISGKRHDPPDIIDIN